MAILQSVRKECKCQLFRDVVGFGPSKKKSKDCYGKDLLCAMKMWAQWGTETVNSKTS